MRVCYFGTYRADYSRNQIMIEGLRRNGVEVIECHEPLWWGIEDRVKAASGGWLRPAFIARVIRTYWNLLHAYRAIDGYDVMVLGYPGQLDVFLARLLAWLRRKPLVLDVFMSIFLITSERGLADTHPVTARLIYRLEKLACLLPDLLIIDTAEYAQWFQEVFGLDSGRFRLVPTGADDRVFYPVEASRTGDDLFRVLHYGTFIPNHGVEHIVEAARILQGERDIHFELIGEGPTKARAVALAEKYELDNITFVDWVDKQDLPRKMARADVCLGAFGTTPQSMMTVQNKIYEGLAMGQCVVTGNSTTLRNALTHGEHLWLCERANPASLAQSILDLKRNPGIRRKLTETGYRIFSENFTVAALGERFRQHLYDLRERLRAWSRNRLLAGAVGVLMLAFLLRTPCLSLSSLWLDEIHSYERASQQSWQAVHEMLRFTGHAPMYEAVLLHCWMKLGTSEFVLRFPSVMSALMSIAATYALGRGIFNAQVGLLSAFLLAVSPLHIYYSQEARMYTLAALMTTLGTYFFFRASLGTNSASTWRYWGGYVLCATLGLYTHYYTGFALLAVFIFGLVRVAIKRNGSSLLPPLLAHAAIGLLFAPWLRTVWAQLQGPRLTWIPPITVQELLHILTGFFINRVGVGRMYPVFASSLALTLAASLFVRSQTREQKTDAGKWERYLFILACAAGPVVIAVVVSLFKPIIVDRYFVIVVPPACVLLALGIIRFSRHRITIPIVLVLVIGTLVSACRVATTQWKEDWRSVATYVMDESMPNDVIVLVPEILWPPFKYYYSGPLAEYGIPANPASESEVEQAFNNFEPYDRLWIIRAERFKVNEKVVDYIASEQDRYLVSCQEFGGFYGVDVCLYTSGER